MRSGREHVLVVVVAPEPLGADVRHATPAQRHLNAVVCDVARVRLAGQRQILQALSPELPLCFEVVRRIQRLEIHMPGRRVGAVEPAGLLDPLDLLQLQLRLVAAERAQT